MLDFACSHCGKHLKARDELAGKKVRCPGCGKPALVPEGVGSVSPKPEGRTGTAELPQDQLTQGPPVEPGHDSLPSSLGDTLGAGGKPAALPSELTDFLGPPERPDELGRLGSYRILRVLGHGGMGVVFQAEDPQLERLVALKVMLPTLAASASSRQRFLREAKAAAAVEHDHIVRIYQVGEDRGVPFLAMEFLRGQPLDERLKLEPPLALAEVIRIGRETALGLAAAHERGLIHRDIKPANLWLESRQGDKVTGRQGDKFPVTPSPSHPVTLSGTARVKILDFGLVRAASESAGLTQQGAIVGTPAYMAPEQARGESVDARCDLWSLGVVLYRLTTGQMPFRGTDAISTLFAIASNTPADPLALNPKLPKSLAELILRLLDKSPEQRPESARAVAAALEQFESVKTQPLQLAPPAPKKTADRTAPNRRKSAWPLLVGLALLLLIGIALALVRPWQNDDDNTPVTPTPPIAVPKFKHPPSCIILWMAGGASQIDTFSPTPQNALFKPIDTSVPGLQFCETLPRLAKQAHHLAVIRTMNTREADHGKGRMLMQTGRAGDVASGYPILGCVLAKELARPKLPGFIQIGRSVDDALPGPAFLGVQYAPITIPWGRGAARKLEGAPPDREAEWLEALQPVFDPRTREPVGIINAYGDSVFGKKCHTARKLVQIGVPAVEVTLGGWDMHNDVAGSGPKLFSAVDEGFSALIADLERLDRLDSTLIVWMSEFGRTPRVNANGGRDHWTRGWTVVLAGAGIQGGKVIGKISDDGMTILERPVSAEELFATIYAALGIDPHKTNEAAERRPVPLVERGFGPIKEVLPQ